MSKADKRAIKPRQGVQKDPISTNKTITPVEYDPVDSASSFGFLKLQSAGHGENMEAGFLCES